MNRYFLEVTSGGTRIEDLEGELHPSPEAALDAAVAVARSLIVEALRSSGEIGDDRIDIRDEAGRIVGAVALTDVLSRSVNARSSGPPQWLSTPANAQASAGPAVWNHLWASAPKSARERLGLSMEKVDLPVGATLVEPGVETPFVYFLESGLASVVASSPSGEQKIEVGHIGFEGMTGTHVLLGRSSTPLHTFMQVAGSGWRLDVAVLRAAVDADAALRTHVLRYVETYHVQLAHSALASGCHTIPERLARWLLMCHDRLAIDPMPLTHEFLAVMLGVRRSVVTNELHVLEGEHAIRATRGRIDVRDRAKLERLAGGSYGIPEAEYEKAFGVFRLPSKRRTTSLYGKYILIVEDDFDLAVHMKRHLLAQGAHVAGPAPSVPEALRIIMATPHLDAAMLDVNLRGEMAFSLAEALRKRRVPFIFVSGYGQELIPSHLADAAFYNKPIEPRDIAAALLAVA